MTINLTKLHFCFLLYSCILLLIKGNYCVDIMKKNSINVRPLTDQEITELKKENPESIISTIEKEKWEEFGKISDQSNPLSAEELKLFAQKMDDSRNKKEFIEALELAPLQNLINRWLDSLRPNTGRNYRYYIGKLIQLEIIPIKNSKNELYTVGEFNLRSHNSWIDYIKKIERFSQDQKEKTSESTKQVYAAVYISLTRYLERISHGWFRPAIPSSSASNPTFFKVHDKCRTDALTLSEWHKFIHELDKINRRDSLIARCLFQGAKRITEALSLTVDQIKFDNRIIYFKQSKTGGTEKIIPITYPEHFMKELKKYITETDPIRNSRGTKYVFISLNGDPINRDRFNYIFKKASAAAGIIKKMSPHVLRATYVTLTKGQGYESSEIMKITGHTSLAMLNAYDKTSDEDNLSKKLCLI